MLSTNLKGIAAAVRGYAKAGIALPPGHTRAVLVSIEAAALMAEALEQTKIAQDTADEMARIMAEQHEGERG